VSNHLFPLGKIVATPGAISALDEAGQNPATFLKRHQSGDWGDCDEADRKENDLSVREEFRIFSVYHTSAGQKIWVITEADRSSTCVLLPDEY
jgi:hypothetical protein